MYGEKKSWRTTVTALIVISLVIGLIQRTSFMFLDPKFEVCVFHLPTVFSIIIYSQLPESTDSQV